MSPSSREDLERALDGIEASYSEPLAINNLDSAALPNRREVIAAYENIAPLIYLGFYATSRIERGSLRERLGRHAYAAFDTLSEQIRRAVSYEEQSGHPRHPEDFATSATLELFHRLPALREALNEDAVAAYENDPAAKSLEEVIFSYPTLKAITAHRVAHVLYELDVPMIPRIISEHAHSQTGIDIHPGAQIGRRFFIDHGTGIVIGETTEIGSDVRLYQGVTLGALSGKRGGSSRNGVQKRHPTIGDRVTVYSGATILGGQTIVGSDSVIGGNVWLVESVLPGTKLFGRAREEQSDRQEVG